MGKKLRNEVRDAVHGLIEFNDMEKRLIDSTPFQRLRDIHQLAMCYQVYPGTTHKRFEHCLGVMYLAGRIFDTIFDYRNISGAVRERLDADLEDDTRRYWRRVVRAGALLHDIGHLPFSHAAEKDLLPDGWNHERITADVIRQSEIAGILASHTPTVGLEHVVSVAWEPRKRARDEPQAVLPPWHALLSEIVTGNTFGADRMDYLLRDSLHAGVMYGRFDPYHLINSLRVVIDPETNELRLGIEIGGIHSAEALLLARYFMFTQVYFHDVRRVYDLHLKDFLKQWLPGGQFPTDWIELGRISDSDILTALKLATEDPSSALSTLAARITRRQHFRTVYTLQPTDKERCPTVFEHLVENAVSEFGREQIMTDSDSPKSEPNSFLVLTERDEIQNSLRLSTVIRNIPSAEFGLIFASPAVKDQVEDSIRRNADKLLSEVPIGL